jgi:outer membrane protein assembly factor BamB
LRGTRADAQPNGSGTIWPGPGHGVEDYSANDNQTAYFASSNMAANFFSSQGGHADPVFDVIENGIGNGTITAIDINTGKIKWVYPTEFPTAVSPAVTNGIVFSGHMTATGKPYAFNEDATPVNTLLNPSRRKKRERDKHIPSRIAKQSMRNLIIASQLETKRVLHRKYYQQQMHKRIYKIYHLRCC